MIRIRVSFILILLLSLLGNQRAQALTVTSQISNFKWTDMTSSHVLIKLVAEIAKPSMDMSVFVVKNGSIEIGNQKLDFENGYFDISTMTGVFEKSSQEFYVNFKDAK